MLIPTLRTALGIFAGALVFAAAPASAATFTFTDDNCSDFQIGGTAGARTLTCVGLPGGPCLHADGKPTAGTFGSPVTITANCTNQPQATGYEWRGNCASSNGRRRVRTPRPPLPP